MSQPLKTSVAHAGQTYLDEPIVVAPKSRPTIMERAVAAAFSRTLQEHAPITVGHERVRLRWMTSDGNGGLKPRD